LTLSGIIKIHNQKIEHIDNFLDELKKLKSNPEMEGREGEIKIDFRDRRAGWYRYKYYWGYLIPPIADAAFDGNQRKAHIAMKNLFAYHTITDFNDIPGKHFSRIIIYCSQVPNATGELVSVPTGYLQSMSTMTGQEAKDFILKVEAHLFEFISEHIENDAIRYRQKAIN